nr:unnamed protein product [Callosobruchus analis]
MKVSNSLSPAEISCIYHLLRRQVASFHMDPHVALCYEFLPTKHTTKLLFSSMGLDVVPVRCSMGEFFPTIRADKRLLTGVGPDMPVQHALLGEYPDTNSANVGFMTCVQPLVKVQLVSARQSHTTNVANDRHVNTNFFVLLGVVPSKVSMLEELFVAHRTFVDLFLGVLGMSPFVMFLKIHWFDFKTTQLALHVFFRMVL